MRKKNLTFPTCANAQDNNTLEVDCHAAPLAPLAMTCSEKRKTAFTLAEVLTTLVVIGIIAVITLPILNSSVDEKTKESQKKTFNMKLKQGLSNMQIHGTLAQEYTTTADFIETMKKYMHITKSCTSAKLSDCFASKIKESQSSTKFETKNIKTSADIEASFVSQSDLGAVVFADGTTAIIAHNPNCVITNIYDTSADTTKCFAMIYDINGSQNPNIIGEDMDTINLDYGDYGNEIFFGKPFSPVSYTKEQCLQAQNEGAPINTCGRDDDYWASAVDTCYKKGFKLPSKTDLKNIAIELYGENVNINTTTTNLPNASTNNPELWAKLGGVNGVIFFSREDGDWNANGGGRVFSLTSTNGLNTRWKGDSTAKAFCMGEE